MYNQFVYKGSQFALKNGIIQPKRTQTETQNRKANRFTASKLQTFELLSKFQIIATFRSLFKSESKPEYINSVIATGQKDYALCYSLFSANQNNNAGCDKLDDIPFVVVSEETYHDIEGERLDIQNRYLYTLDGTHFKREDDVGLEFTSTQPEKPIHQDLLSPRDILKQGIQLYVYPEGSDFITHWQAVINNPKKTKALFAHSVCAGTLRHINQELNIAPRPFTLKQNSSTTSLMVQSSKGAR